MPDLCCPRCGHDFDPGLVLGRVSCPGCGRAFRPGGDSPWRAPLIALACAVGVALFVVAIVRFASVAGTTDSKALYKQLGKDMVEEPWLFDAKHVGRVVTVRGPVVLAADDPDGGGECVVLLDPGIRCEFRKGRVSAKSLSAGQVLVVRGKLDGIGQGAAITMTNCELAR